MEGIEQELVDAEADRAKLSKKIRGLETDLEQSRTEYSNLTNKIQELKQQKLIGQSKEMVEALKSTIEEEWIDRQFAWTEEIQSTLQQKFRFDSFRPQQLAAINATLSKKDVLLVMPTGAGKSLVYQMPTFVEQGFALVVTPLISLIEDQVMSAKRFGIHATSMHSTTPKDEIKVIYEEMQNSKSFLRLLYVTPEWLAKSKKFLNILKKCYQAGRVTRVTVDEVHCCSSWGHDFRPDYGFLGILRQMLATVPFLGVTATATMSVLSDIQTMLSLENCLIITAPFNRPNLFYKVEPKSQSKDEVFNYLTKLLTEEYKDQTGIIYTTTVNDSVNLAKGLKRRGIKVAPYHAHLDSVKKKEIHNKWIYKDYQVIVATMAFGMGIDQPDVRFVIHHTVPKSIETLYQESGRCGRDGQRADCIIMYNLTDYFRVLGMVQSVVDEKKAAGALEYCLDQTKRALLAKHFEEVWDEDLCNNMCDNCFNKKDAVYHDLTSACGEIHEILDNAVQCEEKLTLHKLLDAWYQGGVKKLRIKGMEKPKMERYQAELIVSYLLLHKYLAVDKEFTSYNTLCYIVKGKSPNGERIEMLTAEKFAGLLKRSPTRDPENGSAGKRFKTTV